MPTILVSGASGIVGYGVLRSLRRGSAGLRLVGTSIHPHSVAPAFCDVFELAPRTDDPNYADWLIGIVRRHGVELLIPGIEIDVQAWVGLADRLRSTGAKLALNSPELIRACQDKWDFDRRLVRAGLDCRIESSLDDDFDALAGRLGLPFIVKLRRGSASRGLRRVASRADFEACRHEIGETAMAQRLVGDEDAEFTVAAFGDGRGGHGEPMAMRRHLGAEGFTESAEVVSAAPFEPAIGELCRCFRPVGATNFQFRLDAGAPRLLEINPRISASTSIRAAFGYNEAAMSVEYWLDGRWPADRPVRRGRAVRYTEEIVSYDDDGVHL